MNVPSVFLPGFRISVLDVVVLVIGLSFSVWIAVFEVWFGVVIAFIILHFFLFCNVFRMARLLELVWAGFFVALAAVTILTSILTWYVTLSMTLAITCILVAIQIRKPSYHGIFWKQVNPRLPQWYELNKKKML
ncbi:conserved membrane hypothetical protein [Gammaproteobacteria bacterium]